MKITRKIYRPFKPRASEQVFEFKKAGSSTLFIDLSGNRRKPFVDIIKNNVCWRGSGIPTEAVSGTIGDYLYYNGLVYGPKVGFSWHETQSGGRTPILGYGPPTAMAAGSPGDYFFRPAVIRYLEDDSSEEIPQLYGPRGTDGWDSVAIGTKGFPQGILPLVGSEPPSVDIGYEGDFYVDTQTHTWFGPKTTVWPEGVSLIPDPYIDAGGSLGALYIDTKNKLLYGPKTSSTWEDLTGVYYYTSPRMAEVGSIGDYYLDVVKYLLYGPKPNRYWDGLEGFPEVEHLLVQGATPQEDTILAKEQHFQGGYRCIPKVVTQPVYGRVSASTDQMGFDYTPPSKYWVGRDSFSYCLVNIFGQESDARCIYITIGI